MARNDLLRDRQHRAALHLLTANAATVAAGAGISERTLRCWRSSPEFQADYRALARDAAREGTARILAARIRAVDRLAQELDSDDANIRVRAAVALLNASQAAI